MEVGEGVWGGVVSLGISPCYSSLMSLFRSGGGELKLSENEEIGSLNLFYSEGKGYLLLGVESLERELEDTDFLEWLVPSVTCVISLVTLVSSISSPFPSWDGGGGGGGLLGRHILWFLPISF